MANNKNDESDRQPPPNHSNGEGSVKHLSDIDETQPLSENSFLIRMKSSMDSDRFLSGRSTRSSSCWGFSSHWFNTGIQNDKGFLSERNRAVEKGIVKAAFLIRDAFMGESENPSMGTFDPYADPNDSLRNFLSLVFRQVLASRWLRTLTFAATWILVLLTFVEPPRWCRYGYNGDASITCEQLFKMKGPPASIQNTTATLPEEDSVEYYPTTRSILLTPEQSNVVEWVCISFFTLIVLFRIGRDGCSLVRYLRRGPAFTIRLLQVLAIVTMITGLCTKFTLFQPFARLLLLGTMLKILHQEVQTTFEILPQVLNIFLLMFIYMVFWAFLGTVLFYGTNEGSQSFSNLVESLWTLWICVTTANYPDVMMPAYNSNRLAASYFLIFMIVTFFFFANLIQASVVNNYDDAMKRRRKNRRALEDAKLSAAFDLMDKEGSGEVDREIMLSLFRILNKDFPEVRHISSRDQELLFAILDRDGSGIISKAEFLDFGSIILLEFVHEEELASFVQLQFPTLYHTPKYQSFVRLMKSDNLEVAVNGILALNALVVVVQSWPLLVGDPISLNGHYMDGTIDTMWELIEALFTLIYCVEALLKIIALGWRSYSESTKNIFDFVITILAFVASAYVYYPNEFSDSRIIRYIVMARIFRLSRVIISMKQFRVVGEIWYEILPFATAVLTLLFFVMYAFAALGLELYGGMVTRDPDNSLSYLILNTDFSDNNYWGNNFNDLVSAFNVLFNLLVVNNWTECEVGYEAVTERKWVRLFFLAFHFSGVIVVNNLVIAFFINAFLQQREILEQRKKEVNIKDEAVIHGRQATFDASEITGTRTNLMGNYIARIRSNHAQEDEQDRLRRLFTQISDEAAILYKEREDAEHVLPFARS